MENPGLAQLLTVPTSWDKTRAPHLPPIASQLSAPLKEAASQRGKVPPKKSPPYPWDLRDDLQVKATKIISAVLFFVVFEYDVKKATKCASHHPSSDETSTFE